MSHRNGHHSEYPHHYQHDHGRPVVRRPAAGHPHAPTPRTQNGYTLVHAGKQVRFGPVVFWIVVGTVVMLGVWSAATATYFTFRDDVLTRLIARQSEMQYAYEDRIADLRAKIDRTTSRQMLDQEQFGKKLDQIMRRQSALEGRANALNATAGYASHRIDQAAVARERHQLRRSAEALSDQRYGYLHRTARPRSPPGIARADRQ